MAHPYARVSSILFYETHNAPGSSPRYWNYHDVDNGGESSLPDPVGNWTGSFDRFQAGDGYFHAGDYQYILAIEHQEGRICNGTLIVSGLDPTREYPFSGEIAHDMKTLEITEYGTGMDTGYLLSPDEMELILRINEEDNFSVLCMLKREG